MAYDTREEMLRALEAILFASGYPVKFDVIADVLGIDGETARELARELSDSCEGRGIELCFGRRCVPAMLARRVRGGGPCRARDTQGHQALAGADGGAVYRGVPPAGDKGLYRAGARSRLLVFDNRAA